MPNPKVNVPALSQAFRNVSKSMGLPQLARIANKLNEKDYFARVETLGDQRRTRHRKAAVPQPKLFDPKPERMVR